MKQKNHYSYFTGQIHFTMQSWSRQHVYALTEFSKGRLTFRAWLPFNYTSPLLFRIAYIHQLIDLTAGSVLHVDCDGPICRLLVHVCCHIKIMECRLKKIGSIFRKFVLQHVLQYCIQVGVLILYV